MGRGCRKNAVKTIAKVATCEDESVHGGGLNEVEDLILRQVVPVGSYKRDEMVSPCKFVLLVVYRYEGCEG